jgi:ribosomal protein L22
MAAARTASGAVWGQKQQEQHAASPSLDAPERKQPSIGCATRSFIPPLSPSQAAGRDLRVHFKNTRETAFALRKMPLAKAKRYLSDVVERKRCIPFHRYTGCIGRTAQAKNEGSTTRQGRWPVKSCEFLLNLLTNAESNAEVGGAAVWGGSGAGWRAQCGRPRRARTRGPRRDRAACSSTGGQRRLWQPWRHSEKRCGDPGRWRSRRAGSCALRSRRRAAARAGQLRARTASRLAAGSIDSSSQATLETGRVRPPPSAIALRVKSPGPLPRIL